MKMSTRGRYGLRFMLDLANNGGNAETLCRLSDIARRQNISRRYLEQLALILRRTGFIHSVKGSGGGYSLAKTPSEIRLSDLLRALEGDLNVTEAPVPGEQESAFKSAVREAVYDVLDKKITELLDSKTLASLLDSDGPKQMYYI